MSDSNQDSTPHVFPQRGVETDISLPEPVVGIYETPHPRRKLNGANPEYELKRRAIYTAKGFLPPVDIKMAADYINAGGDTEILTPRAEIFSQSITTVIKHPQEIANELSSDKIIPWAKVESQSCYEAARQNRDTYEHEIPIHLPDLGTADLGQFLSLAAALMIQYIPEDEPVNNYTLGQKIAEVYGTDTETGVIAGELALLNSTGIEE